MNLLALVAALIGVILMSLTVYYGNKIVNKWLRYLAAITGILIAFLIMSYIPSLFGDNTNSTRSDAGTYLGALIVVVVIIKSLFFKNKS